MPGIKAGKKTVRTRGKEVGSNIAIFFLGLVHFLGSVEKSSLHLITGLTLL